MPAGHALGSNESMAADLASDLMPSPRGLRSYGLADGKYREASLLALQRALAFSPTENSARLTGENELCLNVGVDV